MPWNSFKLTKQDGDVLRSFLTEEQVIISRKLSTTEIADKLKETRQRSKKRLLRLKEFGLLELEVIKKGSRKDSLWYIAVEGLFYLLTSFRRNRLREFVNVNSNLRWFNHMNFLITRNRWNNIDYLLNELKDCVSRYQYRKIGKVFYDWQKSELGRIPVGFDLITEVSMRS